jgi:hypothetical protein
MKITHYLFLAGLLSISLTSCYSTKLLVDDDVYVMKSSELPVGESLTDETNYATYKFKQERGVTSSSYYYDPYKYFAGYNGYYSNSNLMYSWRWGFNTYHPTFSAYNHSLYYGNGFYNAFGPLVYDPFTNTYLNYGYNYYGYYGNYNSPFYNPYGSYYGYGNPYIQTNNFPTSSIYNYHSGPRGSSTGLVNPGNRTSAGILKVATINPSNSKPVSRQQANRSTIGSNAVQSNNTHVNSGNAVSSNTRPVYRSTEVRSSSSGNSSNSHVPPGGSVNQSRGTFNNSNSSPSRGNTPAPSNSKGSANMGTRGGSGQSSPPIRRN